MSLVLWTLCIFFHIGYIVEDILRVFDNIPKWIFLIFVVVSLIVLFFLLCNLKEKVKSSYLSEDNEKKYIESFNSLKEIDAKEVKNNSNLCCLSLLWKLFKCLCSKNNRTSEKLSDKNEIILEELREYYKISKERAEQLEKYSSISPFPTWKEEKYIKVCEYIIEKGENIEDYKENLKIFFSKLDINEKRVEELNQYIKEKNKK